MTAAVFARRHRVFPPPRVPTRAALGLLALVLLALAGCGGSGGGSGSTGHRASGTATVETADSPASLPRGWRTLVDRDGGFSIGVPQGWPAKINGPRLTLRAPKSSVVISLTADRSDEALSADPGELATAIGRGLQDRFSGLELDAPEPVRSAYEAVGVDATGTERSTGVRQTLRAIVVNRGGVAAYPILVAGNPISVKRLRPELEMIVRTLRGQPVG